MPTPRRRDRPGPTEAEPAPVRSPGEIGFAQIVGAASLPPAPKRVRKRPATQHPDAGEEPLAEALERALLMVRGGQVDAGLALSQRLWPRAVQTDDALLMGICQHVMAIGYHYSGQLKEALTTGHLGIELFARAGDTVRQLRLMSLHAITLAQLGQAAEAMELLGHAVELLPQIAGEPWQQCVFWNNAGSVYETLNQTTEALAAWERCIELSAHFDEPSMKWISRGNLLTIRLSALCREKADRETVLAAYAEQRRHLDGLIRDERHHLVMNWAAEAADVMIQLGEMDEARELLHMGLRSGAAAGLGPKRASLELQFAHVERLSGQLRPAAAHVAEALALANESQDIELLARVHLESSLLQEAQNHWRAALDCYKRYADARVALLAAQAEARSQALAARVEVERNRVDAELARLRAQLQRQALEGCSVERHDQPAVGRMPER